MTGGRDVEDTARATAKLGAAGEVDRRDAGSGGIVDSTLACAHALPSLRQAPQGCYNVGVNTTSRITKPMLSLTGGGGLCAAQRKYSTVLAMSPVSQENR